MNGAKSPPRPLEVLRFLGVSEGAVLIWGLSCEAF